MTILEATHNKDAAGALEPRARKNCACECVRGAVCCLHPVTYKGIAISCKRNSLEKFIGSPPTLKRSTKIAILSMPTKMRMRRTKCAISIAFRETVLASLSIF